MERRAARRLVLECLEEGPCHADEIQKRSGGFKHMISILAELLEEGVIERGPDHLYRLSDKGRRLLRAGT